MTQSKSKSNIENSEVPFEFNGVNFTMRIFDDPSGLRGQVFYGEEKQAGIQVFHTKSQDSLFKKARQDKAVIRAAERISNS